MTNDIFSWSEIDDVLLDMDGTILDRHFDNFFFEEELPRRYAEREKLAFTEARDRLMTLYRSVEGELDWTDLHYWTRTLNIDVIGLTKEFDHLIDYLPRAKDFLEFLCGQGKRVYLVTNAHPSGVAIKVAKTGLDRHVGRIITAFDVGYLKMRKEYWPECERLLGFDPARSLYVDDDEPCLVAAELHGLAHIYHSSKSSSRLPAQPSRRFRSIENLAELI